MKTYRTPEALRRALEDRLIATSRHGLRSRASPSSALACADNDSAGPQFCGHHWSESAIDLAVVLHPVVDFLEWVVVRRATRAMPPPPAYARRGCAAR